MSLGPKLAKGRSTDQVGLEIKGVVDWGVGGEKPLGCSLGLEFLLLSFSSSDHRVGVIYPVILTHSAWPMTPC